MKLLKPVEKIYQSVTGLKNLLYEINVFHQKKISAPVLSVGNLSFGGVGKTPAVIFLAEELSHEFKVAVVCRSYKAALTDAAKVDLTHPKAAHYFGDEACLIQMKLPNCEVWSGPVKSETAAVCLSSGSNFVIVDDGFSHRQLARDFDLVLIDASKKFHDEYFRESFRSLKRAQAVLLTKTNLAKNQNVQELKRWIKSKHMHLSDAVYVSSTKMELSLETTVPLMVFCALAKPHDFISQLNASGYQVISQKLYPDHHMYSEQDEKEILDVYNELKKKHSDVRLVATEKDAIKLSSTLKSITEVPSHALLMQPDERQALIEKIRKSF